MYDQIIKVGDISLNNKGFSKNSIMKNEWQVPSGGGFVIALLLSIPIWGLVILMIKLIWK